MRCHQNPDPSLLKSLTFSGTDSGPFPSSKGNQIHTCAVDYVSKWVEAKALTPHQLRPRMSRISEASRARGFVLRSQELQILSFILGIRYPNLID
ncbi:hypothetical protein Tco_0955837 [Tanacetum coccineum]|uniref:Uncharacterized protein n=1 Tax=Tanacetum coccineum TaxID=301880 RepID=A0ABQ5E8C9_9ASTR